MIPYSKVVNQTSQRPEVVRYMLLLGIVVWSRRPDCSKYPLTQASREFVDPRIHNEIKILDIEMDCPRVARIRQVDHLFAQAVSDAKFVIAVRTCFGEIRHNEASCSEVSDDAFGDPTIEMLLI